MALTDHQHLKHAVIHIAFHEGFCVGDVPALHHIFVSPVHLFQFQLIGIAERFRQAVCAGQALGAFHHIFQAEMNHIAQDPGTVGQFHIRLAVNLDIGVALIHRVGVGLGHNVFQHRAVLQVVGIAVAVAAHLPGRHVIGAGVGFLREIRCLIGAQGNAVSHDVALNDLITAELALVINTDLLHPQGQANNVQIQSVERSTILLGDHHISVFCRYRTADSADAAVFAVSHCVVIGLCIHDHHRRAVRCGQSANAVAVQVQAGIFVDGKGFFIAIQGANLLSCQRCSRH